MGHLYTAILANVATRYAQFKKISSGLCIGTDEHGLKVQQAALLNKKEPHAYCNDLSNAFQELFHRAQVLESGDVFMRTTERRHIENVQSIWVRLSIFIQKRKEYKIILLIGKTTSQRLDLL